MAHTIKTNEPARAAGLGVDRTRADSETESIDAADTWETLDERITRIPMQAKVRGMFFRALTRHQRAPRTDGHYLPFNSYPMRDYAAKLLATARSVHPRLSPGDALFKLGLEVFCVFSSSLVGSALFSVADHDFRRVLELAPKAYALSMSPGDVVVTDLVSGRAKVQLRNLWLFPDIFQAGVFLGAMKANRVEGTALITRHSLADVDLELAWHRA